MVKNILIVAYFFLFSMASPVFCQDLILIDSIISAGRHIRDLVVTSSGQRIYAISTNHKSIEINGSNIMLPNELSNRYTHMFSIQNPANVNYIGVGGTKLLVTDSSYLVFISDRGADSLNFKDSTIVRESSINGYHFGIGEYSFENNLLRVKNWSSEYVHDNSVDVHTLLINKNKIFISGRYKNASFTEPFLIEDHALNYGRYSTDNFIGKIDYNSLKIDWLTGDSTELEDHSTQIVVNSNHELLQVSSGQSPKVHYCNDSLEMIDHYPHLSVQHAYFLPRDSSGLCGKGFAPAVEVADISALSLCASVDKSFLITCFYGSRFFQMGDSILYDSNFHSNTALVKISKDYTVYNLFQCTGSPSDKYLFAIAHGSNNEVYVAIYSQADTLMIGTQIFIKESGQQFLSIIAKLDKNLNLISIIHCGHFSGVNFTQGLDGKLYIQTSDYDSQLFRLFQVTETTPVRNIPVEDFDISIFPNPVLDGEIHYRITNSSQQTLDRVRIYDSFGRLKHAENIKSTTGILDCTNYTPGSYLIIFENNSGISISNKVLVLR